MRSTQLDLNFPAELQASFFDALVRFRQCGPGPGDRQADRGDLALELLDFALGFQQFDLGHQCVPQQILVGGQFFLGQGQFRLQRIPLGLVFTNFQTDVVTHGGCLSRAGTGNRFPAEIAEGEHNAGKPPGGHHREVEKNRVLTGPGAPLEAAARKRGVERVAERAGEILEREEVTDGLDPARRERPQRGE